MDCNEANERRIRKFADDVHRKPHLDMACLNLSRYFNEEDLAIANEERMLEGLEPFNSTDDLVREFRHWAENRCKRIWH